MPGPLAAKVRAKYPGVYDDLDDATLERQVLAKYPQYADLAEPEEVPAPGGDQLLQNIKNIGGQAVKALPMIAGAAGGVIGGIGGTVAGMGIGGVPGAIGGAALGGAAGESIQQIIARLSGAVAPSTPGGAATAI